MLVDPWKVRILEPGTLTIQGHCSIAIFVPTSDLHASDFCLPADKA